MPDRPDDRVDVHESARVPGSMGDTALVLAVARGSEDALAEIYRRHGGVAFRLAQRVTGDERVAEDVCQDVFLQLWNNPENFDPDRGSLRSWLLMKAHSRSVDLIRSNSARYGRENRELNDPARPTFDIDREVWDLVVADRINAALEALTPAERDSVKLAYFGGLSYREVAVALGQPEGTVKSRIRSALRTLATTLDDLQDQKPGAFSEQIQQSADESVPNNLRPPNPLPGQPPGTLRVSTPPRVEPLPAPVFPFHPDRRSTSIRRDLSVQSLKGWLR